MIFDTHAHYDDEVFDEDRALLFAGLPEKGVGAVVNVGASFSGCEAAVRYAREYPELFRGAVGIHPENILETSEEEFCRVAALAKEPGIVAIGEIGLDYSRPNEDAEAWSREKALQKYWFERYLALAMELELPVMLHSRDAAEDTLQIIRAYTKQAKEAGRFRGGIIHCFSYSLEMAREYVKLGYVLGIGGVVTFKNARQLPEVVREIPLSKLVLETDCPYLAPVPHRGKRNDSGNLKLVAAKIAEIKGITPEEVEQATWENGWRTVNGIFE